MGESRVTIRPLNDNDYPHRSTQAPGDRPLRFRHHVLRLLKERHVEAAPPPPASLYDAARERAYLKRVVAPALGAHYIDLGWTVAVTRRFLEGVASRCVRASSFRLCLRFLLSIPRLNCHHHLPAATAASPPLVRRGGRSTGWTWRPPLRNACGT